MPKRYVSKLENDTMWLIVFNAVSNLALGISFLLFANTVAESVLSRFFPPNAWSYLWIAVGIIGLIGIHSRDMARFSFVLGGMVISVFALASLWGVVVDGLVRAIPTTVFLVYIAGLLIGVSRLVNERENILGQIDQLAEKGKAALTNAQEQDDG